MDRHFATLDGIKRAANKHKRAEGMSHSAALDVIAREAGFANYHAAQKAYSRPTAAAVLAPSVAADPGPAHGITITQNWRDRAARKGGQETRTFRFDKPLSELLDRRHLRGWFDGLQLRDGNTIIGPGSSFSQDRARYEICRVARALQFVSATGLQASRGNRAYPGGDWHNRPPETDHEQVWYDPQTRGFLFTSEPAVSMEHRAPDIAAWSQRHGWSLMRSRWGSVYGLGTELYLGAKSAGPIDLAALEERLAALPAPFDEDDWPTS
jgi:hypothetical protein